MTKKEKEILNWIIERSWEKRANHFAIAKALAELFPDDLEELNKELEEMKKEEMKKEGKENEDTI